MGTDGTNARELAPCKHSEYYTDTEGGTARARCADCDVFVSERVRVLVLLSDQRSSRQIQVELDMASEDCEMPYDDPAIVVLERAGFEPTSYDYPDLDDSEAVTPPAAAEVPEFWVINDKREGPGIWWWDGTKPTLLVHQHDVVYGTTTGDHGVQRRREARERLWDHITGQFPVAPPCRHDGCDDVAIAHPTHCAAHEPEETP